MLVLELLGPSAGTARVLQVSRHTWLQQLLARPSPASVQAGISHTSACRTEGRACLNAGEASAAAHPAAKQLALEPGSRSSGTGPGSWALWPAAISLAALQLAIPVTADSGVDDAVTMLAEVPAAAATTNTWADRLTRGLISLEARRKIFFKYEKRIRDNSTLEKVFDYFSSQEKNGIKYMTPLDLLAAVMPTYPASLSDADRLGSLDGERAPRAYAHAALQKASETVFAQFDVDGDGMLSFWEFRLVLTLLAISEDDVETIFNVLDLDSSGTIDVGEFEDMVALLQAVAGRPQGSSNRGPMWLGRTAVRQSLNQPSGLMVTFFGRDMEDKLQLSQFITFLAQLHRDIGHLEFMHYDVRNAGAVPGIDFARSLVAVADIKQIDTFLGRVEALPERLKSAQISEVDFVSVTSLAHGNHGLDVALQFCVQIGRAIDRDELERLLHRVCHVKLSAEALDIIMGLFSDGSGKLDVHALSSVLQRRAQLWRKCTT